MASLKKEKQVQYLPGTTRKLKHYIKPMLAKETEKPFSNKEWIYEMKWDGYRAIASVNKNEVSLYSRNGNTFNASYPIVINELKKLSIDAVVDGEIIVVDENGKSNFQKLQYYRSDSNYPIEFRVFDVLSINGHNTCNLPLLERKKLLKQLIGKKSKVVKYSDHLKEKGIEFFREIEKKDLEGIMAKKSDSLYYPGVRTNNWFKIKNHKTLEAIIAGFTQPGGSRSHFGALVLGMWEGDKLKYIGHTGSGFSSKGLDDMIKLLKPLIRKKSPFDEVIKTNSPVTWVKPVLVCEIKYTEWTTEGNLRHPIFLRLRADKPAKDVTVKAAKPVKRPKTEKVI